MEEREPNVNIDQLRALNNPLRFEIFSWLEGEGPASARDLAQRMGLEELRLYYHLKKLADVGLIKTVFTRATATKPEAVYTVTQRLFVFKFDLNNPEVAEMIIHNAEVILKLAAKEYRLAVETHKNDMVHYSRHYRYILRMSKNTHAEFEKRLYELVQWVESLEDENGDRFSATIAVSPQVGRKP